MYDKIFFANPCQKGQGLEYMIVQMELVLSINWLIFILSSALENLATLKKVFLKNRTPELLVET